MTIPESRKVQLVLAWYVHEYKVLSITGTTYYKPGEWLSPEVVEQCCALPNWTVTMTDNSMLASFLSIFGQAKSVVPL
jgi:hypothetical protein